jgi:UDP-hydrolysing UDP-N-acetyl-D-glucosamine 2-epimerase
MIKILTLMVDRANYGRLKPLMQALQLDARFEQKVLCTGSMPLRRFGYVSNDVRNDGFNTLPDLYMEVEGGEHVSMGMSIGLAIQSLSVVFTYNKPDYLLIIGDRFEALAATISAIYQNIRVIHLQGGESSGSIDESNRHAISKMAHLHFPATEKAKKVLIQMGENPDFVQNYGCPVGDIILSDELPQLSDFRQTYGLQNVESLRYAVVVFHPNTTNVHSINENFEQITIAVEKIIKENLIDHIIWLWPNIDAGSENIHVKLRKMQKNADKRIKFVKNFKPQHYQRLIKDAHVLIGNSSSFIRDSTFTGTKVLILGNRQKFRETTENVDFFHEYTADKIIGWMKTIPQNYSKKPSFLYGKGNSSAQIIESIANAQPPIQKQFYFS